MKNYSMKPTDENAIEFLRTDPIGRNSSVFRFITLLNNIQESCTIAINGEWGSGKTFFIQQSRLILEALNAGAKMDDTTRNAILSRYPKANEQMECHTTVYYDAWTYDNDDDPILSLLYATIASHQSDFTPDRKRSALDIAAKIANVFAGGVSMASGASASCGNIGDMMKEVVGEDILEEYKTADDIRKMVKEFIDSLILEHGNRLVFFIDELDRCKPDYAIRFLERIKHYFDDDRVTFVFAVSLSQLQATVKNYYGAEFNSSRYLDKFFDLRITLPSPDIKRFMQQRLGLYDDSVTSEVCIEAAEHYHLSLREAERYVRLIKICAFPASRKTGFGFGEANARGFAVMYILPILLILQMTNVVEYNEFIRGANSSPLLDILNWPSVSFHYEMLLERNEEFNQKDKVITKQEQASFKLPIRARVEEVYYAVFPRFPYSRYQEIKIGALTITSGTRAYIEDILSLLSQFSDYKYE